MSRYLVLPLKCFLVSVAIGFGLVVSLPLAVQSQSTTTVSAPVDVADAPEGKNGAKTQTAGTEISQLVIPTAGRQSRLWSLSYRSAATDHNIYLMIPIGTKFTTVTTDAAVGATSLLIAGGMAGDDGGVAASGDWIVVRYADGTYDGLKLGAPTTALNQTVPALTKAVNSGAPVWFMGTPGTTDHALRKVVAKASERTALSDYKVGLVTTTGFGQPILGVSDNATNAGFWDQFRGGPVKVGQ